LAAYNENDLKKIVFKFSKKILALSILLCDIPIAMEDMSKTVQMHKRRMMLCPVTKLLAGNSLTIFVNFREGHEN